MNKEGILIVVSGFSGAGKGTIMKALLERYDNYALSISATTRNPRPGEEEGTVIKINPTLTPKSTFYLPHLIYENSH